MRLSCATQATCSAGRHRARLAGGGAWDLSAGNVEGVVLLKFPKRAARTPGDGPTPAPEEADAPVLGTALSPCLAGKDLLSDRTNELTIFLRGVDE